MGRRSLMVTARRPARRFQSAVFTARSAVGRFHGGPDFWSSDAGMRPLPTSWRFRTGRPVQRHNDPDGGFCQLGRVRHFFAGCEFGLASCWHESARNWAPTRRCCQRLATNG